MARFEVGFKRSPDDQRDVRYWLSYDADWNEQPANDWHFYLRRSDGRGALGELVFEEHGEIEGWGWSVHSFFRADPDSYITVAQFTRDGTVVGEVQSPFSNA